MRNMECTECRHGFMQKAWGTMFQCNVCNFVEEISPVVPEEEARKKFDPIAFNWEEFITSPYKPKSE